MLKPEFLVEAGHKCIKLLNVGLCEVWRLLVVVPFGPNKWLIWRGATNPAIFGADLFNLGYRVKFLRCRNMGDPREALRESAPYNPA